jgi:hypothetical protein
MNIWRPHPALSGSCSTPIRLRFAFTAFPPPSSSTNPSARQATTTPKLALAPTKDDWPWLQTCCSTCLSPDDNAHFDACKYVVASNDFRKRPNYERLASSPVLKIGDCDADICACDGDDNHERADHNDTQLFVVGAKVLQNDVRWVIDQNQRMIFVAQHPATWAR